MNQDFALNRSYLMENPEEALRLDVKTDHRAVERIAKWAGLKRGMRIADMGCGAGKTTYHLNRLVAPEGKTVGIDFAKQRIDYASEHYFDAGIEYMCRDIARPMKDLGHFDFIWIRFVLEYYREGAAEIVANIYENLKPGGILCLIDLDYNCLSHYGMPGRLEKTITDLVKAAEEEANFDPYTGRKLYSMLYDLGCDHINVRMDAHHLFYGELREADAFNWQKKIEASQRFMGVPYDEYPGGYKEFAEEFYHAFRDPRRFTYTPVFSCIGQKPF